MKHRLGKKSYLLWSKLYVILESGPLCLGIVEEEESPLRIQYVFLQTTKPIVARCYAISLPKC